MAEVVTTQSSATARAPLPSSSSSSSSSLPLSASLPSSSTEPAIVDTTINNISMSSRVGLVDTTPKASSSSPSSSSVTLAGNSNDTPHKSEHHGEQNDNNNVKECRICFGDDGIMIAPCRCKGTSKWVHRTCLDQWRISAAKATVFSHCGQCKFKYRITLVHVRGEEWQVAKYRLYVIRDLTIILLACHILLYIAAYAVAQAGPPIRYLPSFLAHIAMQVAQALRLNWFLEWHFWHYYALTTFYAAEILGIITLIMVATGRMPALRFPCQAQRGRCHGACCIGGLPLLSTAMILILSIIAIIGIVVGIGLSGVLISRIMSRHIHMIWMREETKKYVVVDLATDTRFETI